MKPAPARPAAPRPAPRKVLLVDDDPRLRKSLTRYLSEEGFQVDAVAGSEQMNREIGRSPFDLVLLDVMMPGEDGMSACKRLRAAGNETPVIMLTAKGGDVDRILGLELGADDYVVKPFNPRELLARIHAVLRRRPTAKAPGEAPRIVRFGAFTLNIATRALTREGKLIGLTGAEFSLLKALALHPGEPISRDRLSQLARGREIEATDRSLDVQVSRLRRLLGDDAQRPRLIQTVWGYGYAFVPDGEPIR
ncbi:MAG TPA: two-component system response regulator OmpR [Usitatibacter sp.]|nr:two-component system response regulator OmpR [Usitatibacter sp.]